MNRLCPGCATRRLQMDDAPCGLCGRVNRVLAPRPRETMHPLAQMVRSLLRPLGWPAHAITLVACGFAIWAMALHWILPFASFLFCGVLLSWLLAGAIWAIRLAARGAVWLFQPATRTVSRPGGRGFLVLPLCVAALAFLNWFDLPLRVAFRLSQPALERMARAAPGAPPAFPPRVRRAGLYHAHWAGFGGKRAVIQVTDSMFIFSGTLAGFAYCPQGWDAAAAVFVPKFQREDVAKTRLSKDWYWWEIRLRD